MSAPGVDEVGAVGASAIVSGPAIVSAAESGSGNLQLVGERILTVDADTDWLFQTRAGGSFSGGSMASRTSMLGTLRVRAGEIQFAPARRIGSRVWGIEAVSHTRPTVSLVQPTLLPSSWWSVVLIQDERFAVAAASNGLVAISPDAIAGALQDAGFSVVAHRTLLRRGWQLARTTATVGAYP